MGYTVGAEFPNSEPCGPVGLRDIPRALENNHGGWGAIEAAAEGGV